VSETFIELLKGTIEKGRSFGGHPLWLEIQRGELPRKHLAPFAVQFFLQVREFPRAVSALHSRCSDADQRVELAESLYEEETGRISGCGCSHPELFIRFGEAVGASREAMVQGTPLPGTRKLIEWFESSTRDLSFLEGSAAIQVAAEGQVPGAFAPLARALESHYGLSREAVAFWDIHEEADREHSDVGDHIVARLADSDALQLAVMSAVETSLARWWAFFDDIATAVAR
jgi:pyrroloquinoline-quinone synthase